MVAVSAWQRHAHVSTLEATLRKLRRDVLCMRLSMVAVSAKQRDMHMRFPWSLFLQSSDLLENSQGTCFACVCQWSLFLQSSDMHMRFPWSLFLQSSDLLENSQGTCFACVCQWSLFLQSSDMHMRFPWSLFLQSSDLLENSQKVPVLHAFVNDCCVCHAQSRRVRGRSYVTSVSHF